MAGVNQPNDPKPPKIKESHSLAAAVAALTDLTVTIKREPGVDPKSLDAATELLVSGPNLPPTLLFEGSEPGTYRVNAEALMVYILPVLSELIRKVKP